MSEIEQMKNELATVKRKIAAINEKQKTLEMEVGALREFMVENRQMMYRLEVRNKLK